MRKMYSISYDLSDQNAEKYKKLFDAMTGFGHWWHFLSGTWIVATDLNAKDIYNKLRPYLDEKVNILISEVGTDMSGWLPQTAWDWLENERKQVAGYNYVPTGFSTNG